MNTIEKILDKNQLKKNLEKFKEIYFPNIKKEKIIDIEVEKVSPEWMKKSCLARYKITFSDSSYQFIRATAKYNRSGKEDYQIMKTLYQNGFNQGSFQVPIPLYYMEEVGAVIYREVPGTTLTQLLEIKQITSKNLESISRFLVKLHLCPAKNLINRTSSIVKDLDYFDLLTEIDQYLPNLKSLIKTVKSKVHLIKIIPQDDNFLIHGDLYPGNIIINGDKTYFIDFDRTGRGHFLFDLATFYVFLELPKNFWNQPYSKTKIKMFQKLFLKTYFDQRELNFIDYIKEFELFKLKVFFDQIYIIYKLTYPDWLNKNEIERKDHENKIKQLFNKIKSLEL